MNTKFRRNHYIPRFIVNYWAKEHSGRNYPGAWIYNISSGKKYVGHSHGSNPFPFAIGEDLYILEEQGARLTSLERWFASLEKHLALLIRQIHHKEIVTMQGSSELTAAIMGLFSLECRSEYMIDRITDALEKDHVLHADASQVAGESAIRTTLQNIPSYVEDKVKAYSPVEIYVLHSSTGGLILSDRPYFNDSKMPERFFALTNKAVVVLKKSQRPFPVIHEYSALSSDFLHTLNTQVAMNARKWIVAEDEATLDRYVEVIQSDKWKNYRDSDHIQFERLPDGVRGWKIEV